MDTEYITIEEFEEEYEVIEPEKTEPENDDSETKNLDLLISDFREEGKKEIENNEKQAALKRQKTKDDYLASLPKFVTKKQLRQRERNKTRKRKKKKEEKING